MKIYTKTGDRGETRLFDGTKVPKHNDRVEAYGEIDELHSFVGAAAAFLTDSDLTAMLVDIQKDLFAIGAQLADPKVKQRKGGKFQLPAKKVQALKEAIDRFE